MKEVHLIMCLSKVLLNSYICNALAKYDSNADSKCAWSPDHYSLVLFRDESRLGKSYVNKTFRNLNKCYEIYRIDLF